MALIYKLFREVEWLELETEGATSGAPIDIEDGYIHFSTALQVAETARRYFKDVTPLILVSVEGDTLGDDLKWEPSRGGDLFPHLYAKLALNQITQKTIVPRSDKGDADFEGLLA